MTATATYTKNLTLPNAGENAQLALERDGSGNLLRCYHYTRGDPFSYTAGASGTFYYQRDWLGSVADITDGAGAAQWAYSYEPFGLARTASNVSGSAPENRLRFAGEYLSRARASTTKGAGGAGGGAQAGCQAPAAADPRRRAAATATRALVTGGQTSGLTRTCAAHQAASVDTP